MLQGIRRRCVGTWAAAALPQAPTFTELGLKGFEPVGSSADELAAQLQVLADTTDRTIKAARIRVER